MLTQLPLCENPSKRKGEESSQQTCCSFMTTCQCTSAKSQAAIRQCGFQQLNHTPNSLLAPSDYFLFRVMKNFFGVNDFQAMKKSRRQSRPALKSSQKIFFQGVKVVATKVGEVYWVIMGLQWKIKNIFLMISCFFLTQVDKLLNTPRTYIFVLLTFTHIFGNSCSWLPWR